jgi:hypothetical protein
VITNIGYILGHFCEYLLFIYYADACFYPRKSYKKSNLISFFGYFILFAVGLTGKAPISIAAFFIVNIILLMYCYNVKLKNAIFYSLILDTLSCIGEYIIVYALESRYDIVSEKIILTLRQTMLILIGGKLIYLAGIIFLKHFTIKKLAYDDETYLISAIIPILTIMCLSVMMAMEMNTSLYLFFCSAFLVINFITFYINAGLNEKNRSLKLLRNEYDHNKAELSEYQLLYEKYESTKIMRHDFHKQLDVLKTLISTDNVQANEYMRQIGFAQRELDYAQYTDNKILNILLSQKVKECHERNIEIHIHSSSPELSFISDIDTVAIFSNMLDNAIEAAEKAEKKEIYVELYKVNRSYSAVKIENYTDKEPIILDGLLRTQKKNSDIHGVGIKSINNALKKYGSELTWTYDKENKFFSALALMHIPK